MYRIMMMISLQDFQLRKDDESYQRLRTFIIRMSSLSYRMRCLSRAYKFKTQMKKRKIMNHLDNMKIASLIDMNWEKVKTQ